MHLMLQPNLLLFYLFSSAVPKDVGVAIINSKAANPAVHYSAGTTDVRVGNI